MNFPGNRFRQLLGLAIVVAISIAWLLFGTRSNEPIYQGYRLTRWVNSYQAYGGIPSTSSNRSERALTAIRAIGTNALPWMLSAINHEPAHWRTSLRAHSTRLPAWLLNWSPIQRLQTDNEETAATAMKTFEILGPSAAPAIPELEHFARATNAPNTQTRALIALGYIGPPAVSTVTNLLEEPRLVESWAMLYTLKQLGTNAAAAVPVLIDHLTDTNPATVVNSATVLGNLALNAERSVPALTRALTNSDSTVRRRVAEGLEQFGSAARSALPALTNALRDVDPDVRKSAADAIKTVTLETGK